VLLPLRGEDVGLRMCEGTSIPWVESYVTTDGPSANLPLNKAPIWGLGPDFYYCQRVAGLLIWGSLSDETICLLFTIAAGPRQRSHSRVRVPWESRPYFTVSDSRLSFRRLHLHLFCCDSVFVVTETRLLIRCLATDVFSGSAVMASIRHITISL
jgi:hypothetical protein